MHTLSDAAHPQVEICKLLLEKKADAHHYTNGGLMPVHRAAQVSPLVLLTLLLTIACSC